MPRTNTPAQGAANLCYALRAVAQLSYWGQRPTCPAIRQQAAWALQAMRRQGWRLGQPYHAYSAGCPMARAWQYHYLVLGGQPGALARYQTWAGYAYVWARYRHAAYRLWYAQRWGAKVAGRGAYRHGRAM